jgi:hypothetical protein
VCAAKLRKTPPQRFFKLALRKPAVVFGQRLMLRRCFCRCFERLRLLD